MGCGSSSGSEIVLYEKRNIKRAEDNDLKLRMIFNSDRCENHYKTVEKIGTGAFGKVYKVLHIYLWWRSMS